MSIAFGKQLRKLRKEKTDYTQGDMAKLLNISRSAYTYYEIGKSEPNYDKLKVLTGIFSVDYNTLLGYKK